MTRGRRNNTVTIPLARTATVTPIRNAPSSREVEECFKRGKITPRMKRAALMIQRMYATNEPQADLAIDLIRQEHHEPIVRVLLHGVSLLDYGRARTGRIDDVYCREFALDLLRPALVALDALYEGASTRKRGVKLLTYVDVVD